MPVNQKFEQRDHRFVFICGLHRSGTSPLFRILREHPQISGFRNTGVFQDEGQHLQTVIPPGKVFGGPGSFGYAPGAHLTERSPLATPESGQELFGQWSGYWDLSRPYLLEKSPPNLIRTRFLQELFPGSYFVVVLRHPVAVSLATQKWTRRLSLDALIHHWLHCHQIFLKDRPHVRNLLLVHYENLIANANQEMENIYRFLGLETVGSGPWATTGNDRYFRAWLAQAQANKPEFARMVRTFEEQIGRFGYSFRTTSNS